MDEKNKLSVLIQSLKTEIDKIEKEIQRNEMDTQVRTCSGSISTHITYHVT